MMKKTRSFTLLAIATAGVASLTACSHDSSTDANSSSSAATSTTKQSAAAPAESSAAPSQAPAPGSSAPSSNAQATGTSNPLLLALVGPGKSNTDVQATMGAQSTEPLGSPSLASGMPYYAPGVAFTRGNTRLTVCARGPASTGLEEIAAKEGTSCDLALATATEARAKLSGNETLSSKTPLDLTVKSPVTNETLDMKCESQSEVTACESSSGASVVMW